MMKHQKLEYMLTDLITDILQGRLVDAYIKYYHKKAWLPKRRPLPSFVKGAAGRQALQYIKSNKCLFAEKALNAGAGSNISFVNWVYSGTEGSAVKTTFTVTSIQYWREGKVYREEFIHAN